MAGSLGSLARIYIDTARVSSRTSSISVSQVREVIENPTHEIPTEIILGENMATVNLAGYISTPPDTVLAVFHALAVAPTGQPHYITIYPFGMTAGNPVIGGQVVQGKFTYEVVAKGKVVSFAGDLTIQAPQIGFGEYNDPGDLKGLMLGGVDLGETLGDGVFGPLAGAEVFSATPVVYAYVSMVDDAADLEGSGLMYIMLTEEETGGSFTFTVEESSDHITWYALKDYTTGSLGTHEVEWTGQTRRYVRLSVTESNSASKAARFNSWAQVKLVVV